LMPGLPVEVRLRYVQMVPKIDGEYALVVPMIVGPRYIGRDPEPDQVATLANDLPDAPNTWSIAPVPAYPGVGGLNLPETITGERVSLDVHVTSGLPLTAFGSRTHSLSVEEEGAVTRASFAEGKELDNRDFILTYRLDGGDVQAAALSHSDDRGGFVSVMIEPPEVPDEAQVAARELVFVLDTSGSMSGQPMEASKRFMRAALDGLRPGDYFRIIPFSNTARHMSTEALPATPANLRAGKRFVASLSGSGGTEIDTAIRSAFATTQPANTMRIVVFLSDGYIGSEHSVLRTIRQQIGQARIYAFGVGSSVNRYLLDGMAEEGRGYARYVGLDEDALEVAEMLARDLKSPLLTDIKIDWGDLAVADQSPSSVPDLFAGNSVRVYARHTATGPLEVKINGLVNGRAATMAVPVTLTGAAESALPLVWARNRIAELERNVAVGHKPRASDAEITRLGLEFSLQTKNTSFVAVSERVVNDSGLAALDRSVPLPMVHGVSPKAYPNSFAGSSTPEPEVWIGMLVLAALLWLRILRMRGQVWFPRHGRHEA
ncbi:MAG: VWA domain-containing protein, partial [Pseudomonadota bacterium]